MRTRTIWCVLLLCFFRSNELTASNYPSRRQLVLATCPHIELTKFEFKNILERSSPQFEAAIAWANRSAKTIRAFEVAILRFDPFNRPLVGIRSIFPGHNSGNYELLQPGQVDADTLYAYGHSEVYTGFLYVSSIRFEDNTLWTADFASIAAAIKKAAPDILHTGPLTAPEPPKPPEPK